MNKYGNRCNGQIRIGFAEQLRMKYNSICTVAVLALMPTCHWLLIHLFI